MNTINELKQNVRDLQLDRKYAKDMRKNCIELMNAHAIDEEGRYYIDEFGDYIDKYDPDNYDIILYIIRDGDRIYTGNQQIPAHDEFDNTANQRELINYWFRGENSTFNILHQFSSIHNKSIGQRGCGCNQLILNKVKMEVMPVIQATMNVNNIDEDDSEIKNLYGKRISEYKREVKKEFSSGTFDIYMLGRYIKRIMDDIVRNKNAWYDMLYNKNRYWLISIDAADITERNKFIWHYATIYDSNIDDERRYMMTLTIMKDILLYETYKYIQRKINWIDVRGYFEKVRCKDVKMYSDKLLFNNEKAVRLAFSAKYKSVDVDERDKYNKTLRNFMREVTRKINNEDKK